MKIFSSTFKLLILLFCASLLFVSCEELLDPCADVSCLNGGTCDDGDCECPTGFSGTDCSTEDKCITGNVSCLNGGTCNNGACDCPEGFEGVDCSTPVDPCASVTCQNGGTCNNGDCNCVAGYEGVDCSTLSREKFIGAYNGTLVCGATNYTITNVSIAAHSDEDRFIFNHTESFTNPSYEMIITSPNTFDFPIQSGCSGCTQEEGNGSIDENGIITITTTGNTNCVFTLSPQ